MSFLKYLQSIEAALRTKVEGSDTERSENEVEGILSDLESCFDLLHHLLQHADEEVCSRVASLLVSRTKDAESFQKFLLPPFSNDFVLGLIQCIQQFKGQLLYHCLQCLFHVMVPLEYQNRLQKQRFLPLEQFVKELLDVSFSDSYDSEESYAQKILIFYQKPFHLARNLISILTTCLLKSDSVDLCHGRESCNVILDILLYESKSLRKERPVATSSIQLQTWDILDILSSAVVNLFGKSSFMEDQENMIFWFKLLLLCDSFEHQKIKGEYKNTFMTCMVALTLYYPFTPSGLFLQYVTETCNIRSFKDNMQVSLKLVMQIQVHQQELWDTIETASTSSYSNLLILSNGAIQIHLSRNRDSKQQWTPLYSRIIELYLFYHSKSIRWVEGKENDFELGHSVYFSATPVILTYMTQIKNFLLSCFMNDRLFSNLAKTFLFTATSLLDKNDWGPSPLLKSDTIMKNNNEEESIHQEQFVVHLETPEEIDGFHSLTISLFQKYTLLATNLKDSFQSERGATLSKDSSNNHHLLLLIRIVQRFPILSYRIISSSISKSNIPWMMLSKRLCFKSFEWLFQVSQLCPFSWRYIDHSLEVFQLVLRVLSTNMDHFQKKKYSLLPPIATPPLTSSTSPSSGDSFLIRYFLSFLSDFLNSVKKQLEASHTQHRRLSPYRPLSSCGYPISRTSKLRRQKYVEKETREPLLTRGDVDTVLEIISSYFIQPQFVATLTKQCDELLLGKWEACKAMVDSISVLAPMIPTTTATTPLREPGDVTLVEEAPLSRRNNGITGLKPKPMQAIPKPAGRPSFRRSLPLLCAESKVAPPPLQKGMVVDLKVSGRDI